MKKNNRDPKIASNHLSDQSGIALVLTVLILTNLLMITFIVADVILRIGKTSREIGESESAYFAAESAMEGAIYKIEKEYDASVLGTESTPASGTLTNAKATWQSYINPIKKISAVTCLDNTNLTTVYTYPSPADALDSSKGGNKNCVYSDTLNANITKTNPLQVRLQPGRSFELDFSVLVPTGLVFYPTSVDLDWQHNKEGKIIILYQVSNSLAQAVIDMEKEPGVVPPTVPASSHRQFSFSNYQRARLRIINQDTTPLVYRFSPGVSGDVFLPIGIEVTAKGYYNSQKERIIVANRKSWKIY